MKKLMVIGGCGFIGANTVLYFLKKRYRISIIDNLSGSSSKKNIYLIRKLSPNIQFYNLNIKNEKNKTRKYNFCCRASCCY